MISDQVQKEDAETALLSFLFPDYEAGALNDADSIWTISNVLGEIPEAGGFEIFDGSLTTKIYDILGNHVFSDHMRPIKDDESLRVRTAAEETLGAPVLQIAIGPARDYPKKIAAAVREAEKRGYKVNAEPKIVVYSDPKLGIVAKGPDFDVAIDLFTLEITELDDAKIPENPEFVTWFLPAPTQSNRAARTVQSARYGEIKSINNSIYSAMTSDSLSNHVLSRQNYRKQKVLDRAKLFPQETEVYCAVAVAQTILDFHGHSQRQADIAEIMGTTAFGTVASKQVAAYTELSEQTLIGVLDKEPTFDEAVSAIDDNRPLKEGIFGHARTIVGWKTENLEGDSTQWINLLDPYPPNEGNNYWEIWGAREHLNFIDVNETP